MLSPEFEQVLEISEGGLCRIWRTRFPRAKHLAWLIIDTIIAQAGIRVYPLVEYAIRPNQAFVP